MTTIADYSPIPNAKNEFKDFFSDFIAIIGIGVFLVGLIISLSLF